MIIVFTWLENHHVLIGDTLQGINISHLGKRKIIFKMPFLGDMLVSWRVHLQVVVLSIVHVSFPGCNLQYM